MPKDPMDRLKHSVKATPQKDVKKEFKKNGDASQCLINNEYLPEEWKGMTPVQVYFEVEVIDGVEKICTKIIGKKDDELKMFSFNMLSSKKDIETIFPILANKDFMAKE